MAAREPDHAPRRDHRGCAPRGWRRRQRRRDTSRRPNRRTELSTDRRKLRLWASWVLAIGFFWLARPDPVSLRVGGAVVLAGLLIRGWAAGILEKDRDLAVSGPYAFTRNPLYLGSFVIGAGAVAAGGRLWLGAVFLAFFVRVYGGTMVRESADLEARFGKDYRHYREAVPAFLPRVAAYRPPAGLGFATRPFSLRRYARNREYEAILGAVAGLGFLALRAAGWL